MSDKSKKRTLLLVEGESAEPKLFYKILECFPEIDIQKQDIFYYKTNLWTLDRALAKEFGEDWFNSTFNFIEFLGYSNVIQGQLQKLADGESTPEVSEYRLSDYKFTRIFLVFDYERQDCQHQNEKLLHCFNAERLKKMQEFWSESTENGLLYLNYPMVEAYKHMKPLPDAEFLTRQCPCPVLFNKKYKSVAASDSAYTDLSNYDKDLFRQLVIHHLCKASAITQGTTDITPEIAEQYWQNIDLMKILNEQNQCSADAVNGFVHVLATCLFFIPEYNSKLIFP